MHVRRQPGRAREDARKTRSKPSRAVALAARRALAPGHGGARAAAQPLQRRCPRHTLLVRHAACAQHAGCPPSERVSERVSAPARAPRASTRAGMAGALTAVRCKHPAQLLAVWHEGRVRPVCVRPVCVRLVCVVWFGVWFGVSFGVSFRV